MKKILFLFLFVSLCYSQTPLLYYTTLTSGVDSDDTTFTFTATDTTLAGNNTAYHAVIWDTYYPSAVDAYKASRAEVILINSRTANRFDVERGQLGSTARSFNTTGRRYRISMGLLGEILAELGEYGIRDSNRVVVTDRLQSITKGKLFTDSIGIYTSNRQNSLYVYASQGGFAPATAVYAKSVYNYGVQGISVNGIGIIGSSDGDVGVYGLSSASYGVYGSQTGGSYPRYGVYSAGNLFVNDTARIKQGEFSEGVTISGTSGYLYPINVSTSNSSSAKFGSTQPIYLMQSPAEVGFNIYYNDDSSSYKFGSGSSSEYGGSISFTDAGTFSFSISSASGNDGQNATLQSKMTLNNSTWKGVTIDTAYTNAVSKITGGSGITVTKNAKDYTIASTVSAVHTATVQATGTNLTANATRYITGFNTVYTTSGEQKMFVGRACTLKNLVVSAYGTNTSTAIVTIFKAINASTSSDSSGITTGSIALTSNAMNYGADTTHTFALPAGGWFEFKVISGGNATNIHARVDIEY
jgi:hypothetical protein